MTTSFPSTTTYWEVYEKLNKLANAAEKAINDHPTCSDEWYKAWGYAEAMRQACIQCLDTNLSQVKSNA